MSHLKKSDSMDTSPETRKKLIGKKIISLFANPSKQMRRTEAQSDTTSNESDKSSLASPCCLITQQNLSGSLSQSKLMILAQDDGGIYKGPPNM